MTDSKLITPTWFAQRQLKAEAVGDDLYQITGPNVPPSFLGLRRLPDGTFQGYFRLHKDGPDEAVTTLSFDTKYDAWTGTFELYRARMVN